ncbi:MAG: sugar phosphate isomerase/epimerase family protein [Candidatus Thermoplasmatota archaeon]|nr:sugar phosphate isomerase/epimerase family protein [Candidatus Thermoplasmatota archaeon]
MKISLSCPKLSFNPLDAAIRAVAEKFEGMEILAEEEHDASHIEQLKDIKPKIKLSIHAPFSDLNLASLKEEHRRYSIREIKRTILAAEKKGIKLVTFHPGWPSPFSLQARERVINNAKRSAEEISAFASSHNVTLCAENLPGFFSTAEELLEITENICFDIGHANITKTIDSFLDNKKSIKNVHLHENHGVQDEHLPLTGEHINIECIVRELGDKNYVIEATSLEDGEKSREFLKRVK